MAIELVFPEQVFKDELLPNESVLWAGQPSTKVVFTRGDIFLIPFSLLWGGFAIFWELGVLGMAAHSQNGGPPEIFPLFGIPFVLMGLYFIFGRFIYKNWRKKRTYYAVTNQRVLIMTRGASTNVQAAFTNTIPSISKSIRTDGIGTLVFGNMAPAAGMYQNTGMDFFGSSYGNVAPAFYDVPNAQRVYELVNSQRTGSGA